MATAATRALRLAAPISAPRCAIAPSSSHNLPGQPLAQPLAHTLGLSSRPAHPRRIQEVHRQGSARQRPELRLATDFPRSPAFRLPLAPQINDTVDPQHPTFPSLRCTTLSGDEVSLQTDVFRRAPLTLLLLSLSATAESQGALEAWGTPFRLHFGDVIIREDLLQSPDEDIARPKLIELVVEQTSLTTVIRGLLGGAANQSRRTQVPAMRHHDYLCYRGNAVDVLHDLKSSKLDTHAVLVDKKGAIRWSASGHPTTENLIDMSNTALQILMEPHHKNPHNSSATRTHARNPTM